MRMPEIVARVGGQPVAAHVLTLRVTSRVSQPAQAELALAGARRGWPLGQPFTVEVDGRELFAGEVTAVELIAGPGTESVCLLRGYDLLHRLRRRQQPRVYEDVTVADLAEALTSDLGIRVECADPGSRIERLVQHRQSDLELLAQTAARSGHPFVLNGQTLELGVTTEPLELELGESLWQATVEANLDRAVQSVTAIGWRPGDGEVVTERADGRLRVPGQGERTLVDQPVDLLAEAARAALARSDARSIYVKGIAAGDTQMRAGRSLRLSGLDEEADGAYLITEAVHTVGADGYRTGFTTEPFDVVPIPSGTTLTLGRVTSIRDPQKRGRIEISLPAFGDVNLGWLAVLCPGAGPGKGVVALPDPGDLTVVALPHGNPAEGFVLGSLYGTQTPPNEAQHWTIHSGAGQVIVLDDERKSIKLSNADGSHLELAPDVVSLVARTDMVIEAPGHHLNIRAANIDFDRVLVP